MTGARATPGTIVPALPSVRPMRASGGAFLTRA